MLRFMENDLPASMGMGNGELKICKFLTDPFIGCRQGLLKYTLTGRSAGGDSVRLHSFTKDPSILIS